MVKPRLNFLEAGKIPRMGNTAIRRPVSHEKRQPAPTHEDARSATQCAFAQTDAEVDDSRRASSIAQGDAFNK